MNPTLVHVATHAEELLDDDALVRVLKEGAGRQLALACRMLGDGDDARDALQEAWIRAWAHRSALRTAPAVHAWTRTILVRECLRQLRWRAVRRWLPFGAEVPEVPTPGPGVEATVAAGQVAARARLAAAQLSPRQRLCWGLRFDEGWTLPEIAAATGLTPDTIKTHLARALSTVQEAIHAPRTL